VTWLIDPDSSEPVARIPSPVAPVTVNPPICTQLDLIVTPARHGALPRSLAPSCSQLPFADEVPWMVASMPRSVSGEETITSSV
jgi:hypothetical protein